MKGMVPPVPSNIAGWPKYFCEASWTDFRRAALIGGAFQPVACVSGLKVTREP